MQSASSTPTKVTIHHLLSAVPLGIACSLLGAVIPVAPAHAVPNNNHEIIYLSNCSGTNGRTAEMNYYRDASRSGNRERPGATAQVDLTGMLWRGAHLGKFPDGNAFSVNIYPRLTTVGTVNGWGLNKYHSFTCWTDSGHLLYTEGSKVCASDFYCQP